MLNIITNILAAPHLDPDYSEYSNVLFNIGPLEIYIYSFMIMLGVLAALYLGLKEGKKLGVNTDYIIDGLIIILPLAIIGTRLWYVAFNWSEIGSFRAIFAIRDGGLAIHGGFVVAVIATYVYTRYRDIDLFKAFDLIAPGFLIAQTLGRWGNFFNQEAHGGIIGGGTRFDPNLSHDQQYEFLSSTLRLPDFIIHNMYINKGTAGNPLFNYYHPTFLYESLWNLSGFIIILIIRRMKFLRSGDLIAFYLIWYSVGRFFIEFMRTDALYIGDTGLRIAQVTSILMIIAGGVFLYFNHRIWQKKHYHEILAENATE